MAGLLRAVFVLTAVLAASGGARAQFRSMAQSDCNALWDTYVALCDQGYNNWDPTQATEACKKHVYKYCMDDCTMLIPSTCKPSL